MKPFAGILLLLLLPAALPQESLDQLRQHWEYDRRAQLDIKQKGLEVRDGIKVFDISYASPVGNRAAPVGPNGGVVPAYLIVPPALAAGVATSLGLTRAPLAGFANPEDGFAPDRNQVTKPSVPCKVRFPGPARTAFRYGLGIKRQKT